MAEYRFQVAFLLCIAFVSFILFPPTCLAQDSSEVLTGERSADLPGCTDLAVLHKLPLTAIVACDKADSTEVTMPLKPGANGYSREKTVRGAYEFREYQILEPVEREQAFDNLMRLLPLAGFVVKFSSGSMITAHKEGVWLLVNINGESYDVKAVHVNEDSWNPVQDAQGISREMEAHHRVTIYGIQFYSDNQALIEGNSKILGEVLKYLSGNPSASFDVESHKVSSGGNTEDDQEITRKRAEAVVAWLEAHGVSSGRLRPKALGRTKPITENDSPLEIQINDRIELVRVAP